MKVIMIYDQIQAGAGTKDDKMIGLNLSKEKIGPTIMMEQYLKKKDVNVVATLYCGNGYFKENEAEVIRKLSAMVTKLSPDAVICGPSFNYLEYSEMCAKVAAQITENGTVAVCAMSPENERVIEAFKGQVPIVKCPRKGGTGLNDTLRALVDVTAGLVEASSYDKSVLY